MAPTTSLAVATHVGCGRAAKTAGAGAAAAVDEGRCSAVHLIQPPFISATCAVAVVI